MNVNIGKIKSCFTDIITFIKTDISGIFKDMHDISDKLKAYIEEVNSDMDKMSEIIANIRTETVQLDEFIIKNKQTAQDISDIVSKFAQ